MEHARSGWVGVDVGALLCRYDFGRHMLGSLSRHLSMPISDIQIHMIHSLVHFPIGCLNVFQCLSMTMIHSFASSYMTSQEHHRTETDYTSALGLKVSVKCFLHFSVAPFTCEISFINKHIK